MSKVPSQLKVSEDSIGASLREKSESPVSTEKKKKEKTRKGLKGNMFATRAEMYDSGDSDSAGSLDDFLGSDDDGCCTTDEDREYEGSDQDEEDDEEDDEDDDEDEDEDEDAVGDNKLNNNQREESVDEAEDGQGSPLLPCSSPVDNTVQEAATELQDLLDDYDHAPRTKKKIRKRLKKKCSESSSSTSESE